jgi:uncharacterized SAM-binding protein YcdF (DUF218 family)
MGTVTLAALKAFLLPPGLCLLPAVLALFVHRNRRVVVVLLSIGIALLYGLSTPWVARALAGTLEHLHPPLPADATLVEEADAIVVLGCDRYANAPEYGGDEVSACTLMRLRYAAELHDRSGLPLLLSGGRPMGEPESEAMLMARVLRDRFGAVPRWLEERSRNTGENAANTAALLRQENMRRVVLVTHALHMPRAVRSFRRHGLTPLPAPTHFYSAPDRRPRWFSLLPSSGALQASSIACYELLGLAWYAIIGK